MVVIKNRSCFQSLYMVINVVGNKARDKVVAVIIAILKTNIPFSVTAQLMNHILQCLDLELVLQEPISGALKYSCQSPRTLYILSSIHTYHINQNIHFLVHMRLDELDSIILLP